MIIIVEFEQINYKAYEEIFNSYYEKNIDGIVTHNKKINIYKIDQCDDHNDYNRSMGMCHNRL